MIPGLAGATATWETVSRHRGRTGFTSNPPWLVQCVPSHKIASRGCISPCRKKFEAGTQPRELEILLLIAKGVSNKEIAVALDIREGTARVQASNIFAKLLCKDRAPAVSEAFQRGIHID